MDCWTLNIRCQKKITCLVGKWKEPLTKSVKVFFSTTTDDNKLWKISLFFLWIQFSILRERVDSQIKKTRNIHQSTIKLIFNSFSKNCISIFVSVLPRWILHSQKLKWNSSLEGLPIFWQLYCIFQSKLS